MSLNNQKKQESVSVSNLIRRGREILEAYGKMDAAIDSRLLLMYLLEWDSSKLLMNSNEYVADHIEESYMYLIAKRAQGMPLQYITKEQAFMGLDFYVDERVLIPRQDTEVLVEAIIAFSKETSLQKGVEVGVGSGCISTALAHYIPQLTLTAIDICQEALEVASKNISKHHLEERIHLLQSDVFTSYEGEEASLDILVSNPPYITREECRTLMSEVKLYEPNKALTDGGDGLRFYRNITSEGKKFLKPGGLLAYEIGYLQGRDVCAILEAEGFKDVRVVKDLTGKDRVVLGIK